MSFEEIVALSADEVESARESILGVYRTAFAMPPYFEGEREFERFATSLPRHAARPGFRCCLARQGPTGPVLGFAYGYTGTPGGWWREIVAGALDPETAETWLADPFEFVELAVMPAAQGRGIGGRLHDALLAGVPHRTAVLSTRQAETAAMRLYRRRGWIPLLENFFFPGSSDPQVVMGLDLAPQRTGQRV